MRDQPLFCGFDLEKSWYMPMSNIDGSVAVRQRSRKASGTRMRPAVGGPPRESHSNMTLGALTVRVRYHGMPQVCRVRIFSRRLMFQRLQAPVNGCRNLSVDGGPLALVFPANKRLQLRSAFTSILPCGWPARRVAWPDQKRPISCFLNSLIRTNASPLESGCKSNLTPRASNIRLGRGLFRSETSHPQSRASCRHAQYEDCAVGVLSTTLVGLQPRLWPLRLLLDNPNSRLQDMFSTSKDPSTPLCFALFPHLHLPWPWACLKNPKKSSSAQPRATTSRPHNHRRRSGE